MRWKAQIASGKKQLGKRQQSAACGRARDQNWGQLAFAADPEPLLREPWNLSSKDFWKLGSETNTDAQKYKVLRWMIPDKTALAGTNR